MLERSSILFVVFVEFLFEFLHNFFDGDCRSFFSVADKRVLNKQIVQCDASLLPLLFGLLQEGGK